ncbi:MAG: hypothetical protein ACYC4S_00700 [Rhodoferax sp.]
MNPLFISAAVAGAIGFGGAWQIQSWRIQSVQKQAIEISAAQERALHDREQANSARVIAAQNDARAREIGLRAELDAARVAASRLRNTSATIRAELSTATSNACFEPAAPSGELLDLYATIVAEQADEATELAGQADRHSSGVETLMAAWPK